MQVENHLFICVNCLIEYPEFESQAKQNKLATEGKHFCSACPLKDDKIFFFEYY
jgi:DNA gyrase/topoisomerase IV subunit B